MIDMTGLAAKAAVAATPVKVEGWTMTGYGVWSLVIMQVFALFVVVVKFGPKWLDAWAVKRRLDSEEEREDRRQKAEEDASLGARVAILEDRLSRMGQALTFLVSANTTAMNALEAVEPDHPAIKQGRELIAMAVAAIGSGDPFSQALGKLATFKGVGE